MHRSPAALAAFLCAFALQAQMQAGPQRPAGLQTEWDIGVVLGEVSAHAGRVLEALQKIDARAWTEKGGSETYVSQLESSRAQAAALQAEAKALASNPEKLSMLLQVLFRMDSVERETGSLADGVRRYQSTADGQALASLAAENGVNRERVRQYTVDLAAQREHDFEVMDREAQRCRGVLASQPVAPSPGRKK